MNRDHALSLLAGVLLGFVAAFPVYEMLSARQPGLRLPSAAQATAMPPGASMAGEAPVGGAAGPAMKEVQDLRAYVESHPDDADAIRKLADLNLQINELIRARGLYERYVQLRPADSEATLTLANLFFETREHAQASRWYEEYLKSNPTDADALTDLGVCYRNQSQPQKALDAFRRAQSASPAHWQSLFNEVLVLALDLGDLAATEQPLARLKQAQPNNEQVRALDAEIARRRGATG